MLGCYNRPETSTSQVLGEISHSCCAACAGELSAQLTGCLSPALAPQCTPSLH